MTFRVNNFNVPLEQASSTTFTTVGALSTSRHPSGHVELVQDAYDTYQVLDVHYRWEVKYCGPTSLSEDFIFAYKFDADSQSAVPAFPASDATFEVWCDIQASPGWVWKRFGKNHSSATRPTWGVIEINVPSCFKLINEFNTGSKVQFEYPADYRGTLEDGTGAPVAQCVLHICLFNISQNGSPEANAITDFLLECRCTQTVLCSKKQDSTEIIDIGDQA